MKIKRKFRRGEIKNIQINFLTLSFFRIPVNFKNVVYQTAMRFGNEEEWKKLYDISIKTTDNSERLRILRGLAATRDYNLLKLYF
jgi:hypothetical protein